MIDAIVATLLGAGAVLFSLYVGILIGQSGILDDHEFWRPD